MYRRKRRMNARISPTAPAYAAQPHKKSYIIDTINFTHIIVV
jgi:hypothetical protein